MGIAEAGGSLCASSATPLQLAQRRMQLGKLLFYETEFAAVEGMAAEANTVVGFDDPPRQRGRRAQLGLTDQLSAGGQRELERRLRFLPAKAVPRQQPLQAVVEIDSLAGLRAPPGSFSRKRASARRDKARAD